MSSDSSVQASVTPSPSISSLAAMQSHSVPKFGTVVPNRIFVGGIPAGTAEEELKHYFSAFGAVKDAKIISNQAGVSKGRYGFVTFETLEDAERLIKREEHLIFKERKLNIGQAIRKQGYAPRVYDQAAVFATAPAGTVWLANSSSAPYSYGPNGMTVIANPMDPSSASAYANQPQIQMILPATQQPYYYSPTYQSPPTAAAQPTQWTAGPSNNAPVTQYRWANPSSAQNHQTSAAHFIYPVQQQISSDMLYAHAPHGVHHSSDISDASMIEAATAEPAPSSEQRLANMFAARRQYASPNRPKLMGHYRSSSTTSTKIPPPRFVTKIVNGSALMDQAEPLTPPPTPADLRN